MIDAYTVEFGQRNESIFYGFFVFLSKLAAGCVTGGTMLTLKVHLVYIRLLVLYITDYLWIKTRQVIMDNKGCKAVDL